MTDVTAPARRPLGYTTFADLTALPMTNILPGPNGMMTIRFDGELTLPESAAILDRMTSSSDGDQADRALIRGAVDDDATNLPAILAAYVMGDPLPTPILPA